MGILKAYTDIRIIKKNLRQRYRGIREKMPKIEKSLLDAKLFNKLTDFIKYKEAKKVLIFVSTEIEVDTINVINDALIKGKTVAVPKCLDKKGSMAFFVIKSLSELKKASFNLLEPDESVSPKLVDFSSSICILPGFAFDSKGYRIGFGKGYYDRFLQKYTGVKIGICYNSCIADELPHGRYDVQADFVVTPKYIISTK